MIYGPRRRNLFPIRIPPGNLVQAESVEEAAPPAAPRKFVWVGNLIRLTRRVTRQTWEVAVYGIPVIMGIVSGMVWSRRDVLYAPGDFHHALSERRVGSGRPEAVTDFIYHLHENAKLLRYGISQTIKAIQQGWTAIQIVEIMAALIVMYWEFNRLFLALWGKQ